MKKVARNEVIKLLDNGIIYPISNSKQVSPTQIVPKKSGVTIVKNENNELIPTRTVTGWHMCIDYRKLNSMTIKIISIYLPWTKFWKGIRDMNFIVSQMDILDITKL